MVRENNGQESFQRVEPEFGLKVTPSPGQADVTPGLTGIGQCYRPLAAVSNLKKKFFLNFIRRASVVVALRL